MQHACQAGCPRCISRSAQGKAQPLTNIPYYKMFYSDNNKSIALSACFESASDGASEPSDHSGERREKVKATPDTNLRAPTKVQSHTDCM
jgi:hypothetical protein